MVKTKNTYLPIALIPTVFPMLLFWLVCLIVPGYAQSTPSEARIWSDNSGTFSVEAELIEIFDNHVTLKKANGVVIQVPFRRLSKLDLRYVNSRATSARSVPAEDLTYAETTSAKPIGLGSQMAEIVQRPLQTGETGTFTKAVRLSSKTPVIDADDSQASQALPSGQADSSDHLPNRTYFQIALRTIPEHLREAAKTIASQAELDEIRSAVNLLSTNWPTSEQPGLRLIVQSSTRSKDARVRKMAIDLLAMHDSKQSLRVLTEGLDDLNFDVRWACYAWLEKLNDVRSIETLSAKLATDDRDQAAAVLESFGFVAEPAVVELLKHESEEAKFAACALLTKIGTRNSLMALTQVVDHSQSVRLRMQAETAIAMIERRVRRLETQN